MQCRYDFSAATLGRFGRPCERCDGGPEQPLPLPGFVLSSPDNMHGEKREEDSTGVIIPCHIEQACLGGVHSSCADGYSKRRCGVCSDDWYRVGGLCHECTEAKKYALPIVLVLAILAVYTGFLFLTLCDPRVGR